MKIRNQNKIDLIFFVSVGVVAMSSAIIDTFRMEVVNFPVYSCKSIGISYAIWAILFAYSLWKDKEEQEEPKYVNLFMMFTLPFLHILFIIVGFIIGNLLSNLF